MKSTHVTLPRSIVEKIVDVLANGEDHKHGCKIHAFGPLCTCGHDASVDGAISECKTSLEADIAEPVNIEASEAKNWKSTIGCAPCQILYTDLINGQQVLRDDMWLATTAQLIATPQEPALNLTGLHDAVLNALNDELAHGAYDCKRVWEAWNINTMSENDFSPVSDRIEDIASSVVNEILWIAKAASGSAHTPGSWTALQTGEIADENGNQVAHVFEFKNLRVIAAAPDLLSELRKMRRAYVNLLEGGCDRILALGGDCDPVDVMEASNPSLLSADAAIAKATGGTP